MRNHGWTNDDKKGKNETDESPDSPDSSEYVFENVHCVF